MASRELRIVRNQKVVGSVSVVNGELSLSGAAIRQFERLRERVGDEDLGRGLMTDGWSNGYLYLGPVVGQADAPSPPAEATLDERIARRMADRKRGSDV